MNIKKTLDVLAVTGVLCCTAGYSSAQNNHYEWVKQIGGTGTQYATAVTTDAEKNSYTVGQFSGNTVLNLGGTPIPLTSNGISDIFILKLDPAGNFMWLKQIGGAAAETPYAIKTDAWGGLYVSGGFGGTVDFDPDEVNTYDLVSATALTGFVLKLDTAGQFQWAHKTAEATGSSAVTFVSPDKNGYVYATGFFSGTASFAGANYDLISNGGTDVFVCKMDTAGNFQWAKSFGAAGYDYSYTLKTDASGNVYTMGMVVGIADFDPGTGTFDMQGGGGDYGGGGVFLSKLDDAGNFIWAKQLGNNTNGQGGYAGYFEMMDIDVFDNVYLGGWFIGSVDLDPGADSSMVTSNGSYDAYLVKLDTAGQYKWGRTWGGTGADYGRSVTTDALGNVYTGGFFRNTVDFDPSPANTYNLTSLGAGMVDIFMSKFDSTGSLGWALRLGGARNEYLTNIHVDPSNNVYSAGNFLNAATAPSNFHTGPDTVNLYSGGYDGYIHKMSCVDTASLQLNEVACNEFISDGISYNNSGVYVRRYWSTGGCDSIVTLNLTVNHIEEPVITVNNFELGVTSAYNSYQWLKNGTVITGATNATYTVSENASYQVIGFTQQGCSDTSVAYTVNNASTGIDEHSKLVSAIHLYPNPTHGNIVHIESPVSVNMTVNTLEGRQIMNVKNAKRISLESLTAGIYMIVIKDEQGVYIKTEKLVKQ